jgi:carotenoid cleavage dioxygenase
MVTEDRLPFVFDASRGSRFGLLPRRAEGASTRWFALPSCMIFHSLAAWEEEGGALVRLFACRMDSFELSLPSSGADPASVNAGSPVLYEFTFDTRTGAAEQRPVVALPEGADGMEFPKAHPALTGKAVRYGYLSLFKGLLITGVIKVDLRKRAIVGRIDYPPGACGGEAFFAPRHAGPPRGAAHEDDGHLLTYVSTATASELWVMDAKSMAARPLAVLPLPARVPYGFHSTWLTEAQLAAQAAQPAQAQPAPA